ncbi:MAG: Rpn family recombination-promoting nuclease/putative transposase [Lachnospiraceae bacterium]|nr:Rpn family recombination-promoting nuclease/putative transposase [Lachnospiraceae bacterium]
MKKNDDNFIMLPIVDFCFKELMQNAKIRQGFIAALLAVKPETVQETELMPAILPQEHADDKLGILDVRVKLVDGTQMDFEMQVVFFDYWEKRILFYLGNWMKFFNGKSRKEFEDMAQTDEYIGEACEALKKLSADERKRLEYEAREKALHDYNSQVKSYYNRGHTAGQKKDRGRINSLILKLAEPGRMGDITRAAEDRKYQEELLKEFGL